MLLSWRECGGDIRRRDTVVELISDGDNTNGNDKEDNDDDRGTCFMAVMAIMVMMAMIATMLVAVLIQA